VGFEFSKDNIKWVRGSHGLPECVFKIKIPSVTHIINSEIPDPEWDQFVKEVGLEEAERIRSAAGNRGSATHTFVENFISKYSTTKDVSEALKYTQEESPKILETQNIPKEKIEEGRNLFYKFYYSDYSNRYLDILAIELGIYSPSLFYRGKLDIFYKDKIYGLAVTDIKSLNGKIKKNSVKEIKYKYQLASYVIALEEMYAHKNICINYSSILCIDKQSDILQEIELCGEELKKYKNDFKTICLQYHKINNEYLIK